MIALAGIGINAIPTIFYFIGTIAHILDITDGLLKFALKLKGAWGVGNNFYLLFSAVADIALIGGIGYFFFELFNQYNSNSEKKIF